MLLNLTALGLSPCPHKGQEIGRLVNQAELKIVLGALEIIREIILNGHVRGRAGSEPGHREEINPGIPGPVQMLFYDLLIAATVFAQLRLLLDIQFLTQVSLPEKRILRIVGVIVGADR